MNARDLIRVPAVTEKNNIMRLDQNKYVFKVHPDADKIQVRNAIEKIFSVKVVSVRTQNVLGKIKRTGRFEGRRPSWKKAIVRIRQGQSIPIFEGV